MEYCKQGFIEKNSFEFILLGQSQRNHHHIELYTKVLEFELSADISLIEPFSRIRYEVVKSRDDSAFVGLNGLRLNEENYSIAIHREANVFDIQFKGGSTDNYPEKLLSILENEPAQIYRAGYFFGAI